MSRAVESNLLFIEECKNKKLTNESSFKGSIVNNCIIGNINGEYETPARPENGFYYVSQNKKLSGDWAKSNVHGYMTYFEKGTWQFIKPSNGMILWGKSNKKIYVFSGGEWRCI